MALQGPIPIEFGTVFPDGAYAAGGVDKLRDFDKSKGDHVVQQTDKTTGLPLWVIEVIDADPEARQRTVKVKVASAYQPMLPDAPAGSPFVPVEFEGLAATPFTDGQVFRHPAHGVTLPAAREVPRKNFPGCSAGPA